MFGTALWYTKWFRSYRIIVLIFLYHQTKLKLKFLLIYEVMLIFNIAILQGFILQGNWLNFIEFMATVIWDSNMRHRVIKINQLPTSSNQNINFIRIAKNRPRGSKRNIVKLKWILDQTVHQTTYWMQTDCSIRCVCLSHWTIKMVLLGFEILLLNYNGQL